MTGRMTGTKVGGKALKTQREEREEGIGVGRVGWERGIGERKGREEQRRNIEWNQLQMPLRNFVS